MFCNVGLLVSVVVWITEISSSNNWVFFLVGAFAAQYAGSLIFTMLLLFFHWQFLMVMLQLLKFLFQNVPLLNIFQNLILIFKIMSGLLIALSIPFVMLSNESSNGSDRFSNLLIIYQLISIDTSRK